MLGGSGAEDRRGQRNIDTVRTWRRSRSAQRVENNGGGGETVTLTNVTSDGQKRKDEILALRKW